jgi:hypothetical protein
MKPSGDSSASRQAMKNGVLFVMPPSGAVSSKGGSGLRNWVVVRGSIHVLVAQTGGIWEQQLLANPKCADAKGEPAKQLW